MKKINPDLQLEPTSRAMVLLLILSLIGAAISACGPHGEAHDEEVASSSPAGGPTIEIDDVYRFYEIYDAAEGRPTATQLQEDYLDAGSPGLRIFADARNTTGDRIAAALAARPEIFSEARRCMEVLPNIRRRVDTSLQELGRLYPEADFPPVTIAIGRGRPVGIGNPATGIQIGLEALCATEFLNPDVEDRFVHVIAHEYVHVQQDSALTAAEELGDLGYWVGYRIAKSYYMHATDKREALREILEFDDARAFLAASGWRPGIVLY